MILNDNHSANRILTVSEFTSDIKRLLEAHYPLIWLTGEISNFRMPVSGHYYFTLKDEQAQISSVMFRGQNRSMKFQPEDGLHVTGLGRISVYEPRGTYQVIFEYLEPKGIGALQVAFEQLKKRLGEEGLFDDQYKKPLPFLPRKITVITSPTGAVVHDIINVVTRRCPNIHLEVIPVRVQGKGADIEIVRAIALMNCHASSDLAILARGGGSLEDLQAFNSEIVARAVFASQIPIISAIGHETDFSISDFVADLRAPTPSAAAELAVPVRQELELKIKGLSSLLSATFDRCVERVRSRLTDMTDRLVHPGKKIQDSRIRIDDYTSRMIRSFRHIERQKAQYLSWNIDRLLSNNPAKNISYWHGKLDQLTGNLVHAIRTYLNRKKMMLREKSSILEALNPVAILSRGYSITRTMPGAVVVRHADDVSIDQNLEVILSKGSLVCRVEGKTPNGEKDV